MSEHKPRPTCILADGRRVKYALKARSGEPHYFVVFRGPANERLERSTKETNKKRAEDAAVEVIRKVYDPQALFSSVSWDEAQAALARKMAENNNRQSTIDDYLDTITQLRATLPTSRGPADIPPQLAKDFKARYQSQGYVRRKQAAPKIWQGRGRKPKPRPEPTLHHRTPYTVSGRLRKLRVIWSRWFISELGYVTLNPWQAVAPPKLDKQPVRLLTPQEINELFGWLLSRHHGWRLPILFFTVKSFVGNRITELCSLTSDQLQDGRVVFPADATKGRKERKSILPPDVYAELAALAGPTYVWEAYSRQLLETLIAAGRPHHKVLPDFDPERLKGWLQDEIDDYCRSHPTVKRFSAHAFRKRAMTKAWQLGIRPEEAALAFGCNPKTMMAHYVAMDEQATSDAVLQAVADSLNPNTGAQEANGVATTPNLNDPQKD
jgi:site-specific recombinase XerD